MSSIVLSDMRDAIESIKMVLSGTDGAWLKYHLSDGQLKARSRHMQAGTPVMCDEEMVVSSKEFEKIIKTLRQDPDVLNGPKAVVLKSGKSRITLSKLVNPDEFEVKKIEGDIIDLDDQFLDILTKLSPLIETNKAIDWQSALICNNGQLIATQRSQIVVAMDYEPFAEVKCLLPSEVVKFIVNKKETPEEMIVNKNAVQFSWPDESWVTSSLISGSVPGKLFKILDTVENCEFEPSSEHIDALKDVISLGGTKINFDKDGAWSEINNGRIDTGIVFPTNKEGGTSAWSCRLLMLALSLGDKFNFKDFPQPCTFEADGLKGLLSPMLSNSN